MMGVAWFAERSAAELGSGAERWVSKGEKRVTVTPGRSATGSQEIGDGWRRDLGDCEA